jgi:hypothetical protein
MEDHALLSLFRSRGAAFFQQYPDDEPALGAKLHEMVGSLARHPRQFPERLDLVLAGRHLLPDEDQDVLTAWSHCRRTIREVGRLQGQRTGVLRQRPVEELESACRRLAQEARKAMPPDRVDDDREGSQKQACLRRIAPALLDGNALLPGGVWQHDALWQKIGWYFHHRQWPSAPLRKMCPKSRSPGPGWIALCAIVAVVATVVVIGGLSLSDRFRASRDEAAATPDPSGAKTPHAASQADSSERTAPQPRPSARRTRDTAEQAPRRSQAAEQAKREREVSEQAARRHAPAQQPETDRQLPVGRNGIPSHSTGPAETGREIADRAGGTSAHVATKPTGPGLPTGKPPSQPDDPWAVAPTQSPQPKQGASAMAAQTVPPTVPPQADAPPPDEVPPDSAQQPQVETWKAQAEQFARQHAGKFFDSVPFVNGESRIPADALPAATDDGALFLGGGVLYFDDGRLFFGVGFHTEPPVSRHEVPELASIFGFPSVYVELQRQSGSTTEDDSVPHGAAVVLGHVPESMPPDAEDRTNKVIDELERNARMIRSELRAYNAGSATEEEKAQAFNRLIELTRIEIPRIPPKPHRLSPEFLDDPAAYGIVLDAYNEAVVAHNRARARVIPTAKRAASTVEERQERLDRELRRSQEQLRQHNEQRWASLRQQCRRISVIVYRAAEGAATAGSPSGTDAAAARSPGRAVGSVDGRFLIEERPAQGLNPPAVAQIRPLITGEDGRPVPPWYHGEIVTACQIVAENADRLILRTISLRDLLAEKTADVFHQTKAARVRFEFSPRGDAPIGGPPKAPVAAASCRIESVEPGRQYTVKLQLTNEALDWLRLLAGGDSSGP